MAIKTRASLFNHLQLAMEVEQFTVPPYLTALFSIPDGENPEAARIIHSVVMEEMLHMVLVANVMNAVGARPRLDYPGFVAGYPCPMPHCSRSFVVDLAKFSPASVQTFMSIELPDFPLSAKRSDSPKLAKQKTEYSTIGEFYTAIEKGFKSLHRKFGDDLFPGDPRRQVDSEYYYGGGGEPIRVHDLHTALEALNEIKQQGEGKSNANIWDGDREKYGQEPEPAHYFRFQEIDLGQKYKPGDDANHPSGLKFTPNYKSSYPARANPNALDYPRNSAEGRKMDDFNRSYTALLAALEEAFNGRPDILLESVGAMYKLKYLAQDLMRTPIGDGTGENLGPSFQYYPYSSCPAD